VQYIPNLVGGTYEVFAWYPAHSSRATNTPYTVNHASGNNIVSVNQQINGGMWWSLGTFTFNPGTGGSVTITTGGTNGYVIADAVRFVQISF
jgi:hyaluronate lyase